MGRFAVFDIDGTLFRSGLYREVIFELVRMGAVPERLAQTYEPLELAWKQRAHGNAFREFEYVMATTFDTVLTQIKISDYDRAVDTVITAQRDNVYVYTRDLVRDLKKQGYTLIAISGSQEEMVQPFAEYYGFDIWVGQHFERAGDYFTGEIVKTHEGKDKFLSKIIAEHKLDLAGSIGVGDSGGDIEMLEMVEHPIAFNPESNLLNHAKKAGWEIVIERKNVIYTLREQDGSYVLAETN